MRMLIGSSKSPLNSSDSSWARAFRAITVEQHVSLRRISLMLINSMHTFKCLIDVNGLLGTRLKVWDVALGLAESHGTLVGDLCSD